MPAHKNNKYASFNNLDRILNKKKGIGSVRRLKELGGLERLLNLMSLEC